MLTNVTYTDFEAIDEYLDWHQERYGEYPQGSILEDWNEYPPIIIERAESTICTAQDPIRTLGDCLVDGLAQEITAKILKDFFP